ncbi:MAG: single-stranded-DNA-specific exonuclease RecJ [Christensenellaceae bacterium]|nr:single-stranded-DNA-specific exonuclease RecJ [Christensenellaceae bacterium]
MLNIRCRAQGEPRWARPYDMSEPLWRLLAARGVQSEAEARAFLHPSEDDLLDPMGLSGMAEAVRRIWRAKEAGETVCVWGDYDVDGVSAAALLSGVFRALGIDVFCHIPSRHGEGYGLNEAGIREVAGRAQLLITVDCGVNAHALVALARDLKLDVVVTDHHRPGEQPPDCPVVNPLLGGYANRALCGAGVAFKLASALDADLARGFIDLAALATVADVVSLTGENRAIAALGIKAMNDHPRPGIAQLMAVSGIAPGTLGAGKLAFQLGPRLNAGGRVGSARRALDLLAAPTPEAAHPLAEELDRENSVRRALERTILSDAEEQLKTYDLARSRVIVLSGDDWNPGVIGLAASRLVERYHLPTVLLAGAGEVLTGSCRSIPDVDIFCCLQALERLLARYGGHRQAAGLTIERGRIEAFRAELGRVIAESTDPGAFVPSAEYDLELPLEELSLELVDQLELLEPTGCGNPAPVFLTHAAPVEARAVGRDGAHLQLTLAQGGERIKGIWFGAGALRGELSALARPVLYVPRANAWMNRVSLQLEVKAIGAPPLARALDEGAEEERLLHAFLTQRLYNKRETLALPMAEPIGVEALCGLLAASPRGTLVAAADFAGARALLNELSARGMDGRLDVCVGRWPDDARCFNALAVLPEGDAARGYERLAVLGAPAGLLAGGFAGTKHQLTALDGVKVCAQWVRELPDRDMLRDLYRAVRALLRRPYAPKHPQVAARELSELSHLTPAAAHAGLYALREMDLIDFHWGERALTLRPFAKAEPDDSAVFRLLKKLRAWGGVGA